MEQLLTEVLYSQIGCLERRLRLAATFQYNEVYLTHRCVFIISR